MSDTGRPRGFSPPRRFTLPQVSRACCIPLPTMGFTGFPPPPCHLAVVGGRGFPTGALPFRAFPSRKAASTSPQTLAPSTLPGCYPDRPRGLAPLARPSRRLTVAGSTALVALMGFPSWSRVHDAAHLSSRRPRAASPSTLPSTARRQPPFTRGLRAPLTRPGPTCASDTRKLTRQAPAKRLFTPPEGEASGSGHRGSDITPHPFPEPFHPQRGLPVAPDRRARSRSRNRTASTSLRARRDPPRSRGRQRTRGPKSGPVGTSPPGCPSASIPHRDTFAAAHVTVRSAAPTRPSLLSRSPVLTGLFPARGSPAPGPAHGAP
jgi:hypothetical protein